MASLYNFRLDPGVLAAAKERAAKEGITLPEVLRRVLEAYTKGRRMPSGPGDRLDALEARVGELERSHEDRLAKLEHLAGMDS